MVATVIVAAAVPTKRRAAIVAIVLLLSGPHSLWGIALWLAFARLTIDGLRLDATASALVLWFASLHWFFATNHRNDFGSLHVSAAFVGFDEFSFYRSAVALLINTFAHVVLLLTATLPSKRSQFRRRVLDTVCWLFMLRCVVSVLNVSVQRHHLMLWAIFAPRFVFDAVTAVVAVSLRLSLLDL
eukprot:TRINITY_DN67238_c2_g3_i1.p2 TRINITY_DN67238_c2_g3~~TRINITY_DN67238_c2_g3_i1.p2  ORF type:complete len:185 (+),score=79.32 TRINITY_DN67238_c2_g3_i1:117-671(+)